MPTLNRNAFDANVFGDSDLHVIDGLARPNRLDQHIGKAQNQEVLDCLFAEIMVDAENSVLVEHCAHAVIDGAC